MTHPSQDDSDRQPSREQSAKREPEAPKKLFEPPELTRHESLPEVTTGFVGSFSP